MKFSLPFKLGIFIVLLFSAVIATCLLWTPIKIRHYIGKFRSGDGKERINAADNLLTTGKRGRNAFAELLDGGEEEIAFLLKHGNLPPEAITIDEYNSPMSVAIYQNYVFTIEYFLHKGADMNCRISREGPTPNGGWRSEGFDTALNAAADWGRLEVIRLLLRKGADINKRSETHGYTALYRACYEKRPEIVRFLIRKGADIGIADDVGNTPLHAAAIAGNRETVEILIRKGADIRVIAMHGKTPLHAAAISGSREVVEILVEKGAQVSVKDTFGETPLHYARSVEVITFLIEKKAGFSEKTKGELLIMAAYRGNKAIADFLIENGADVNAKTKSHRYLENDTTPLHCTAIGDHSDVAEVLISNGADVNATNFSKQTPLDLAIYYHKKIVVFLRKRNGKTGEELGNQESKEKK